MAFSNIFRLNLKGCYPLFHIFVGSDFFLLHFYIVPMIGELGRDGKHMNFVKVFLTTNLARKIWRRRGVGGWWSNLRKCQCRNECLESRYWNIGLVQSSHTRAASRQSSPGKRRPIRPEYLPENEEK